MGSRIVGLWRSPRREDTRHLGQTMSRAGGHHRCGVIRLTLSNSLPQWFTIGLGSAGSDHGGNGRMTSSREDTQPMQGCGLGQLNARPARRERHASRAPLVRGSTPGIHCSCAHHPKTKASNAEGECP